MRLLHHCGIIPTVIIVPAIRLPSGAQDAVWLLLFGCMAAFAQTRDASEIALLAGLAAAQIVEPKIAALGRPRGKASWILLKLVLGYLLIGYTGGLGSSYYLMLLLPVVSAATALGILRHAAVHAGGFGRLPFLPAVRGLDAVQPRTRRSGGNWPCA